MSEPSDTATAILDLDELPDIAIVVTGYQDQPFIGDDDFISHDKLFDRFQPVTGECRMQVSLELRGTLLRGFVSAQNLVVCYFDVPGRDDIRNQVLVLVGTMDLQGFVVFVVEPPNKTHPADRALIMTNIPVADHAYGRIVYPPDETLSS